MMVEKDSLGTEEDFRAIGLEAVSYTHLTLPTIGG